MKPYFVRNFLVTNKNWLDAQIFPFLVPDSGKGLFLSKGRRNYWKCKVSESLNVHLDWRISDSICIMFYAFLFRLEIPVVNNREAELIGN